MYWLQLGCLCADVRVYDTPSTRALCPLPFSGGKTVNCSWRAWMSEYMKLCVIVVVGWLNW